MLLPETEQEYRNALVDAAELGAQKALECMGLVKPFLKLTEAYRLYGEGHVKRWIREELIIPVKDGDNNSSVRIDRLQIESVAKASNRIAYKKTIN